MICSFVFEIWWPKFASELSGRVRIRIRRRIAATAVHPGGRPRIFLWTFGGSLKLRFFHGALFGAENTLGPDFCCQMIPVL